MRTKRDKAGNLRGKRWQRALAGTILASLLLCGALASHLLFYPNGALAHNFDLTTPTLGLTPTPALPPNTAAAPGASPGLSSTAALAPTSSNETPTPAPQSGQYLYFVLKEDGSFVLARAKAGANSQPEEAPLTIAIFDDAFGESPADCVVSLQVSPDERFLAIDGSHSDAELLWIFDTDTMTLKREPSGVSGTFLHWLPDVSGMFLYRPVLPLGPGAPLDTADWNPGLWIGNALLGTFLNIDLHTPSTTLIDATVSPDSSQIVYSTSRGLGFGSDIWSSDIRGRHQAHLLHLTNSGQSVAGMFSWSPDGRHLAYERLSDSPTPFRPAGLWVMDRQGHHQRLLAQTDGGHGFSLRWSPDSQEIAYVTRTNATTTAADQSVQALQSAINVVDITSGRVWSVATPQQTGVQLNVSPMWSANSQRITFAAYNPLNPDLGGTVHYWSVEARPTGVQPSTVQVSRAIARVIAIG